MEETIIAIGMILKNVVSNDEFRILYIGHGYLSICKINTNKLEIEFPTLISVNKKLRNNIFTLDVTQNRIIDFNDIKEKQLTNYNKKKQFVDKIVEVYGPTFVGLLGKKTKPIINKFISESGYSKAQTWNIIRKYLQSGFYDNSLLDTRLTKGKDITKNKYNYKKKPGRKPKESKINKGKVLTEADRKNFEKYLKKYLKSEVKSIQSAYDDMCSDCYSIWNNENESYVMKIDSYRPTYNQFYFYIKKNTTEQERESAKKTWRVIRNDKRVFRGTVMNGVSGPGHMVEMDAQEMDISIVSEEYPDICIGRPILYVMIDVFSQLILAYSIALDNNSVVGCTNCFLNLIEDKTKLFVEYCDITFELDEGYTINDVWPTGIRPAVIKVDRGSDFISDEVLRIAGEINTDIAYVSPGTGSMKPLVENFFGTIKKQLDDLIEKKGLIRSVYGSKHHKQACLDIKDVRGIVLNHILYHNTHFLRNYQKSADMKIKKLLVTPANLWKYGVENMYNPKMLPDQKTFLYKVLKPAKATISKKGINYQRMRYFNPSDEVLNELMFHQQMKEKQFDIRIDTRDMGHIYYIQDGELQIASLDPFDVRFQDYYGMSLQRFIQLEKENEEVNAIGEEMNQQARIELRNKNKLIIKKKSNQQARYSDTKNLRVNRTLEKEKISRAHSIATRFELECIEKQIKADGYSIIDVPVKEIKEEKRELMSDLSKKNIQEIMEENSRIMFEDDNV